MLSLNELADLQMQQQIAHEIYRQQIIQRIPDPFPPFLHIPVPHHMIVPPRPTLPGTVKATLENNDLWQQFHEIGTEMIITKSGRRMFPSMRVSFCGLEEETNYCVLLEMIPIGDCRYKFSGSQWVPAGGAEPQSPQRMFLHPDSPATGTHWQSQPILFNKVKLTNNTLDSSGHIVLASMHKYQPRLHIIRSSDLTHLPWAPQQAFIFPETEFVAVTAYQNDRITKLKIDNNPFAKGFRETGQSRCKRKLNATSDEHPQDSVNNMDSLHNSNSSSKSYVNSIDDDRLSISSLEISQLKRLRSTGSIDDNYCFSSSISSGSISPHLEEMTYQHMTPTLYQHHSTHMMGAVPMDMLPATCMAVMPMSTHIPSKIFLDSYSLSLPQESHSYLPNDPPLTNDVRNPDTNIKNALSVSVPSVPPSPSSTSVPSSPSSSHTTTKIVTTQTTQSKRNGFSISAILAY